MAMVRDLVCGMDIDSETAADSTVYRNETFYFCSSECKRKFDQEPERYLAPLRAQAAEDDLLEPPIVPVVPPVSGAGSNTPLR